MGEVRDYKLSKKSYELFKTRFVPLPEELELKTTHIVATHKERRSINWRILGKYFSGQPVTCITALNSPASARCGSESAAGYTQNIYMAPGVPVILTQSISPQHGVSNGSRGAAKYVVYKEGRSDPRIHQLAYLLCHLPNYTGSYYVYNARTGLYLI